MTPANRTMSGANEAVALLTWKTPSLSRGCVLCGRPEGDIFDVGSFGKGDEAHEDRRRAR